MKVKKDVNYQADGDGKLGRKRKQVYRPGHSFAFSL